MEETMLYFEFKKSLKFVPRVSIDSKSAMVQIVAWRIYASLGFEDLNLVDMIAHIRSLKNSSGYPRFLPLTRIVVVVKTNNRHFAMT